MTAELPRLERLLPPERVGAVLKFQTMSAGPSGSRVYSVTTTQGEFILKVHADTPYSSPWEQQLRAWSLAAERGIAPAIVHIDDAARAIVSKRAPGVPLVALREPEQRQRGMTSLTERLRLLHEANPAGLSLRDPLTLTRRQYEAQRIRSFFPTWARDLSASLTEIESALVGDDRRALSHNDLNPTNVLWDGTQVWLVDWEVSGLAHPFYDLAAIALFTRLDDDSAFHLLTLQEQRPPDAKDQSTFRALRRLAALLCGLTFAQLLPDLSILPASAPTLDEVYAGIGSGRLTLPSPQGKAAFAAALLQLGTQPTDGRGSMPTRIPSAT